MFRDIPEPCIIPSKDKIIGLTQDEKKKVEESRFKALDKGRTKLTQNKICSSSFTNTTTVPLQTQSTSFSPKFVGKSTNKQSNDNPQLSPENSLKSTLMQANPPISCFPKVPKVASKERSSLEKHLHTISTANNESIPAVTNPGARRNLSDTFTSSSAPPLITSTLTPSQKDRMEANRLKALAKRTSITDTSSALQQRSEFYKKQALERLKRKASVTSVKNVKNRISPLQSKNKVDLKSCVFSKTSISSHDCPSPIQQVLEVAMKIKSDVWFHAEYDRKYHQLVSDLFSSVHPKCYDSVKGVWQFHIKDYSMIVEKFKNCMNAKIKHIPFKVVDILQKNHQDKSHGFKNVDLSCVGHDLLKSLYTFQRVGVEFGVRKNGRVLIADDMGLGKTIQSITLAMYYKDEWPLLVICPSSVKMAWHKQFLLFVPSLGESDINVVHCGKDDPCISPVNIISYALAATLSQQIQKKRFKIIIADESHFLKSRDTIRTKKIVPLLQDARRVFLLSGTPALSRPKELFMQISAVDKDLFSTYTKFSKRYCDAKKGRYGLDDNGCTNSEELNCVLQATIMIRRLKENVLSDLPDKWRNIVVLDPNLIKHSKDLLKAEHSITTSTDRTSAIRQYYQETALTKINGVCEFLSDKMESQKKLIVFAHHQVMLDALQQLITKKNVEFIRIDGATPQKSRQDLVDQFNDNDKCMIALLSITAAGQGLTLTGSSIVIFAELYWNPGHLIQAEDRAHRIGQRNAVTIIYLIAKQTADDYLWVMVKDKLNVLTNIGIGKRKGLDGVTASFNDSRQKKILGYFGAFEVSDSDVMRWLENSSVLESTNQPTSKRPRMG